jgi:Flp pilus assembly protein protease CpaA
MRAAEWLVVAWSLAVLVTDLSVRRIPNILSLGATAVALGVLAYSGHSLLGATWPSMLLGVVLALALTLPGYFAHWLGAGDIKLLVAIALLGGWETVLISFAVGALLGGLVVLVLMMVARYSRQSLSSRRWIPFGAALSLGLLLALWARA